VHRPSLSVFVYLLLSVSAWVALPAASARAFEEFSGARATGMGGAGRAFAIGENGPVLNPSGMVLARAYTVDGEYAYASRLSGHFLHAAVVDDTSSYNIAAGFYYTYHVAEPTGGMSAHGHEGGLALAVPFGEYASLGATVKYFRLEGDDAMVGGLVGGDGGVTFDIGATVRPLQELSLGVVGTNLRDLHNSQGAQGLGYGAAYLPFAGLVLAAEGITSCTPDNHTGRKGTSVLGGVDWTIGDRFALRAGGGYDATTGNGYLSGGLSAISEVAAFDVGLRQDLWQHEILPGVNQRRATVVGVSLRLFVPAAQTQPQ
jgi:hypothetical protein